MREDNLTLPLITNIVTANTQLLIFFAVFCCLSRWVEYPRQVLDGGPIRDLLVGSVWPDQVTSQLSDQAITNLCWCWCAHTVFAQVSSASRWELEDKHRAGLITSGRA